MFDNLNFLFIQGVKTPCFRIFVLLNSKYILLSDRFCIFIVKLT
nr:MAG TPA: hypothetical protein [Caudoviricetes sp.]